MTKQTIEKLIQTAIGTLGLESPRVQVDVTKDKQHGDFASNIALILAKSTQRKPRELAEEIVKVLPASPEVAKVEIAGPGFINFFLSSQAVSNVVMDILSSGENYGRSNVGEGKRVHLEFVSSNPTGPLHVGHGRQAAYGAVLADILETVGYKVHREYYINDDGRQMDILAVSIWLRYLELLGEKITFPANAYKGNYVIDIAKIIQTKNGKNFQRDSTAVFKDFPRDEPEGGDKEIYIDALITRAKELLGNDYKVIFDTGLEMILADMQQDLAEFGVHFQNWFSEREFTKTKGVEDYIQNFIQKDLVYEREGALWFRATNFGDEKDRVLKRSNGQSTYFANDLGYLIHKFNSGYQIVICVVGSDHHGYVARMKAGAAAYDFEVANLIYPLIQFVTLYRQGQIAQMSTRGGTFVTLRELRDEVGNDATRFFYVMRRRDQPVDFDLDLAKSQSNENPVFYIQYAYARICSVFRQLAEKQLSWEQSNDLTQLDAQQELALLAILSRYPDILVNAAKQYEPHILTNYLRELASAFHGYYNSHQFLVEDQTLRNARLTFITAVRQVLANGLKLLGVSTPESM